VIEDGKVIYPYYNDDKELKAAKIRYPDKRFQTSGEWASTGLFGQHLFNTGGKFVTVVEGEYDALAAFQLSGSQYPVVSIRNGASGALKDCKASYEWLDSFETIVICFDADEVGQKAAVEVANLVTILQLMTTRDLRRLSGRLRSSYLMASSQARLCGRTSTSLWRGPRWSIRLLVSIH
jgi:hypothetical protein